MRTLTGEYGFYFADFGHKKNPPKKKEGRTNWSGNIEKKKLIVNLCKKLSLYLFINIPGIL